MKIVVGSLQHETNTFSPVKPAYEDFDFIRGEKVMGKIAATNVFQEAGAEIIPTIYANAVPAGRLGKETFIRFRDELVNSIPENEKIDGIWLYLHGAMEVENIGSGEVALLTEVRKKVGFDVPIAVALDFHANNSEKIVELANIICGYRTAPHIDMKETQIRAAKLLLKCICEGLLPRPVIVKVPLVITGDMVITAQEPAKTIMEEAKRLESEDDILDVSVFNGQPWVDSPNTGASIIITAMSNREAALEEAKRLGRIFWDSREKFRFAVEACEPEAAIALAVEAKEDFVMITDSGDNTTAGAAGDNTLLLKILLQRNVEKVLVGGITDSHAVQQCRELKIGDRVNFKIGAEIDTARSETAEIVGFIKQKGRVLGWDGEDAGKAVVIAANSIDIVITEKRCAFISPEIFNSIGINIFDYKIVVVKLGYLYPELAKVSNRMIIALTPGASCESIEMLKFHRIKRPVYPIDKEFSWNPYV